MDISEIIKRLKKAYPRATIALGFANPLELLVSTILSAQCTDVRVNQVTPALFKRYPTAADYAGARDEELEQFIKPTGFYHNKTKSIKGAAKMIVEEFDGRVPGTMEELIRLPGVARKTANIVLYHGYKIIDGIAVDTHVRRLSRRMGLTHNDAPEKIEVDLMKQVPRGDLGLFSDLLIEHGRTVCKARKANCKECFLNDLCISAFKV